MSGLSGVDPIYIAVAVEVVTIAVAVYVAVKLNTARIDRLSEDLKDHREEFHKHEEESVKYREGQVELRTEVKNIHKRLDRAGVNGRETRS